MKRILELAAGAGLLGLTAAAMSDGQHTAFSAVALVLGVLLLIEGSRA